MAAKVFGTIFVIADQQTLDCSIVRACPLDWWIVTASMLATALSSQLYNAKFRHSQSKLSCAISLLQSAEAAVLFSIILSQSTTFTRPLGVLFRGV